MSSPGSRAPFPLRLAVRLLPEEVREEVLGDLIEHWHLRVSDQRWLARVAWAWRQPVTVLLTRLRFSRPSDDQRGEADDQPGAADGRNMRVGVSWLDFKLGFRMLIKYPGLTLVGGLALAFAIWVGATAFEALQQVVRPSLPLDEGDRIVEIVAWDAASNRGEPRLTHDFLAWRQQLRSVEDLVAFRTSQRNLITGEALGYPLTTAEISPSAFRLARVPPLHGRFLVEDDERTDAPPVLVLGYETWQTSFGADATVVGQTVRLGAQQTTVVGVMPEGFAFPYNHRAWTPLRLDPIAVGRREGAGIQVLGRLAPGASLEEAGTEMSTLVQSAALEFPLTDQYLGVNVEPYGRLDIGATMSLGLTAFNLLPVILLVLICANVALLMIARAATRESELAVRSALGASRRRIVGQLFVEALVLGGVAAAVGLAATGFGLRWVIGVAEAELLGGPVPFWIRDQVSTATIVYTVALTLLGALVTGVAPALKVTRSLGAGLKQATPGGGGMTFGGVWIAVIVIQVAATVVLPFVAFAVVREGLEKRNHEVAFADEEFLGVQVRMDRQASATGPGDETIAALLVRYGTAFEELERRVSEDPNVLGVTYAERLPRTYHGWNQVEMDGGGVAIEDPRGHRVGRAAIDVDYFEVLDAPLVSGRGFTLADLASRGPLS